jgi:hypothetical protein
MIQIEEPLRSMILQGIRIGEVYELHLLDDGTVNPIGFCPLAEFLRTWGYALIGRRWNDHVAVDDLPNVNRQRAYIGVIHDSGAFLKEI